MEGKRAARGKQMSLRPTARPRCASQGIHMNTAWPFDDPPHVATITVRSIIDGQTPILLVYHDAEDGGWQFLDGRESTMTDARLVSLQDMVERDHSLCELADLPAVGVLIGQLLVSLGHEKVHLAENSTTRFRCRVGGCEPIQRTEYMARDHRNVAVVIGFDADGQNIAEDIVPLPSYRVSGSILLNSPDDRRAKRIRFMSVRVFDEEGKRVEDFRKSYALDGREVEAIYRRPDGSIIEKLPWE